MNLLITGGMGFIGSNLISKIIELDKHKITIVDDFSNISGSVSYDDNSNVRIVNLDIRSKDMMRPYFECCDAVIHLAAQTRVIDSIESPYLNFDINVQGTFNILELIREYDIKTFINASTGGAIIGDVPPPVHEEMVPKPSSPYGASKLFVEGYCSAYADSYGINSTSLRFSNIYGPHSKNKSSVVAAFIKDILLNNKVTVYGDGTQTRDYLYVDDLADGIMLAIEKNVSGVYQLGSGSGTSINKLISIMKEVMNIDFEIENKDFRQGEILHTYCNIDKSKNTFGFDPSTKLYDGIEKTYSWFKKL